MSTSFSTAISVDEPSQLVFDAINDVRSWWGGEIDGRTDVLGAEFTYRVGNVHYSKQRITELVPLQRVGWLILDSRLSYLQDEAEWTGTTVSFEISELDGRTQVQFTHSGLVPEFECYDGCSTAWGLLVNGRLRSLIGTGDAGPDPFADLQDAAAGQP
jgi:hypothetical protein